MVELTKVFLLINKLLQLISDQILNKVDVPTVEIQEKLIISLKYNLTTTNVVGILIFNRNGL